MDNYSVLPLWAVPIYMSTIDIEDSLRESIKGFDYERIPTDNGWFTKDKHILESTTIKESIMSHVKTYVSGVLGYSDNLEFQFTTSWVVKHSHGDWAHGHSHANSLFSGVVYIDVDEQSGGIVFEKERSFMNIITPTIALDVKHWNLYNSNTWAIIPKPNTIIIFPSHIPHLVNKNQSHSDRYCLAFNVFPKGKIGDSLSELVL